LDENLRKKILEKILPSDDENKKINQIIELLTEKIKTRIKSSKYIVSFIEAEGSTGMKETHLKGDSDVDLFVALDIKHYEDLLNIESRKIVVKRNKELFLDLCTNIFKPALQSANAENIKLTYAEHPYISAKLKNINLDLVGCFDINRNYIEENGPITAVDRTPHHSKFIRDNLKPRMRDDVRILKAFFRAAHVYGDKSAVGRFGFTGFSSELLIYHFKNIENLFNSFSQIPKTPIDFYGRPRKKIENINHFKDDYFIIIDPIDKNRNVASSISSRAFKYAHKKMQEFQKDQNMDYFIRKEIPANIKIDQEYKDNYVVLELESDQSRHYTEVRDKLYSYANSLKHQLQFENTGEKRFGKTLFEVYFEGIDFSLVYHTEKGIVSEKYKRKGPPVKDKKNFKRFKAKHPDLFVENGWALVLRDRKYTKPIDLITNYLEKKKLFSGVNLKYLSNSGKRNIGKKALYIMKNMVMPIELK
jgi:tRNA nucleotidyltransferase (CCA-adding enzyme)